MQMFKNVDGFLTPTDPVVVLELGLMIFALIDLIRRERTKGPKWLWAIIIVLINIIGPVVYLW